MSIDTKELQLPAEGELPRFISAASIIAAHADTYVGKRRWTRYAIGMRLEVTSEPDKCGDTWLVRTHNVSGGGMGFWSSRALAKGTRIHLRECTDEPGARWLTGRVTYCTLGIEGYLVGVAFCTPARPEVRFAGEASKLAQPREPATAVKRLPSVRSLPMQCALRGALAGAAGVTVAAQAAHLPGLSSATQHLLALGAAMTIAGLLSWLMLRREAAFLSVLQAAVSELATGAPSTIRLPPAPSLELSGLRQTLLELGSRWRRHADAERVQRERLEELTRIKSNILSIVSHDLRTPLTSILLYARMLTDDLETMPGEDQRRFLGIISDECTRLSRLLDDLLEVQRLESGRVEWQMKRQDLTETIHASARVFEAMARGNSIEFTVNLPHRLPPLTADPDKISQVLSNLLSNAMKYTPPGGKVSLSAEVRTDHLLICVTDNGPGIPRDKWDQIFDRFSQLSNSETRSIAGVGLGLYIVREIVQKHGGRVWVDSELGRGSEFYVSLPLDPGTARAGEEAKGDELAGRVIFCDADPELAAVVAQTLHQAGFEVHVVHSAARLLERLDQGQVDVVVTDLLLPDMSAPELLGAFEALESRSFSLVLHSYEDPALPVSGETADIFLRRPASKEEMVQTVHLALQRKRCPAGEFIVLVGGDDSDLEPLRKTLCGRGRACQVVWGLGEALDLVRNHKIDLLLVDSTVLGLGWANLEMFKPEDRENVRIVVLCREVRKADRRLAEAHRVRVVSAPPGAPETTADAVLSETPIPEPEIQA